MITSIFAIIGALLPFALSELQQFKVISPQIASLITAIEGSAASFTSGITTSNGAANITATSLLSAISAAVTVLQSQTTIPPATLAIIQAVDSAIQAGLAARNITSVDPTALKPISPISA